MEPDPLRYPIGPWRRPENNVPYDQARIWIDEIAVAPAELREAVQGLTDKQLDTPYRDGGWTVRQVVHHLPDSHINAYIRFRNAATAKGAMPVAQPYDEAVWAELADAKTAPVQVSLNLLEALHNRWARLLRSLDQAGLDRRLLHPEIGEISIGAYTSCYAWHGRHHVMHITALRQRMGW
jgi:DinB superfamily